MSRSFLWILVSAFGSGQVLATQEQKDPEHSDKYCYVAEKAYSMGARFGHQDKILQCLPDASGVLAWHELNAKGERLKVALNDLASSYENWKNANKAIDICASGNVKYIKTDNMEVTCKD
ncbi:DUF1496 domain-containing protein [Arsukibacterium sp.]|uniref:DUF1496 domain-containing protein n=1 Tax=Arsukibacterium sp. TaxID=1977258 RepID=UPI001BD23D01|nr:DUF1496 domain-containing protein [Arsukibacterium sp.]